MVSSTSGYKDLSRSRIVAIIGLSYDKIGVGTKSDISDSRADDDSVTTHKTILYDNLIHRMHDIVATSVDLSWVQWFIGNLGKWTYQWQDTSALHSNEGL